MHSPPLLAPGTRTQPGELGWGTALLVQEASPSLQERGIEWGDNFLAFLKFKPCVFNGVWTGEVEQAEQLNKKNVERSNRSCDCLSILQDLLGSQMGVRDSALDLFCTQRKKKPPVMAEKSFRKIYNLNNRMQSTYCSWICMFMNPNPNEAKEIIP